VPLPLALAIRNVVHPRSLSLLVLLAAATVCPGQIGAPQVGLVRYASGSVAAIFGLPGNYLPGEVRWTTVDALASSSAGALLAQKGQLLLLTAEGRELARTPLADPHPLLSLNRTLDSALAWSPASARLLFWNGTRFHIVSADPILLSGTVLSLEKSDSQSARILLRYPTGALEQVLLSLSSGAVLDRTSIAESASVRFRYAGLLLALAEGKLSVLESAGSSRVLLSIAPSDDLWFEPVSDSSLHLHARDCGRDWVVDFSGAQPVAFELPPLRTSVSAGIQAGAQ
jgi:hypothetical protein